MKIKIVSNYRSVVDVKFYTTDEVVPCIGDEVVWEFSTNGKIGGRMRGTVKKRTIDYTIPPTSTDRYEVTLQMQNAELVFVP